MRRYFTILAAVLALTVGAVGLQPAEATWGTSSWRTVKTFSSGCTVKYRHTTATSPYSGKHYLGTQTQFSNCYSGNPITLYRWIGISGPEGNFWQEQVPRYFVIPQSPTTYTTPTDASLYTIQYHANNGAMRWCGSFGCFPSSDYYYAH